MNELDDVLSVKKFVEDYLAKFYEEKPLLINWVNIVKLRIRGTCQSELNSRIANTGWPFTLTPLEKCA
jgi:hypothetical protein